MKINEAIQPSTKTLMETLGPDNDSGFKTEDLVTIYRTHIGDNWHPATLEECLDEIDALMEMEDE
jgi:hypothetical protein